METKMKNLIMLSFLTLTVNAFALTPQKNYENSVKAVLILDYEKCDGTPKQATGFFIGSEGVILTNYHVVRNTNLKTMIGKSIKDTIYSNFEILSVDPDSDIAVLKVSGIQEKESYLELVSSEKKYLIGDEVNWIGHPIGAENFTFSNGYISQLSTKGNVETIQFNGVGYHGNSGSPILNSDGEVIGILHGGTDGFKKLQEEVGNVMLGSGRENINQALQMAKNIIPVAQICRTSITESKSTLSNINESKNDLASLIRELKAYTPPEERKLGSL